jgi:type IV pilus assembly protein PilA
MEMIMKRALAKKNGKKGFTLVEVIVVLVILAILAAIAIPALTGYIDKARDRALITEARTISVALQAIASDAYGDGYTITAAGVAGSSTIVTAPTTPAATGDLAGTFNDYITKLTKVTYGTSEINAIAFTDNKLTGFTYQKTGAKTVTYNSTTGKYTIA